VYVYYLDGDVLIGMMCDRMTNDKKRERGHTLLASRDYFLSHSTQQQQDDDDLKERKRRQGNTYTLRIARKSETDQSKDIQAKPS